MLLSIHLVAFPPMHGFKQRNWSRVLVKLHKPSMKLATKTVGALAPSNDICYIYWHNKRITIIEAVPAIPPCLLVDNFLYIQQHKQQPYVAWDNLHCSKEGPLAEMPELLCLKAWQICHPTLKLHKATDQNMKPMREKGTQNAKQKKSSNARCKRKAAPCQCNCWPMMFSL